MADDAKIIDEAVEKFRSLMESQPVSYTHLTLPTIA